MIQIGKLEATNSWYSILNLIGAVLILFSLFYNWNTSAVIIEIFWIMISIFGIYKATVKNR